MPFGYHGAYLRIDLSTGRLERRPLDASLLRGYLGGSGLGARLLLDEGAADRDALDPAAPLIFAFSPLVGSPLTTSAKFAVVSKSPLTERINDSLASSGFAVTGKSCGADAIVIVGRAAELSVLILDETEGDGGGRMPTLRLEPAANLAGATCQETERALKARLGAGFRVASIGPAGEQLVRYATISHDGRHAGRGGSGAVLGSKNIKAIAVRGTQRVEWADPPALTALSHDLSQRSFGPATAKYRELGTATNLLTFNRFGALPTRNFQQGSFDEVASLSPEQLATTRTKTRESCVACTIGCEHIYSMRPSPPMRATRPSPVATRPAGRSNTRACSRSARCAASAMRTRCCARRSAATSSASTRSAPAAPSHSRWSASSGAGSIEPWLRFGYGEALLRALELIGARDGHRRRAGGGQSPRGGGDRPRQHRLRPAGQRPGNSRATSRARCRRWRSASPSAPAVPITTAAAPTKSISPIGSTVATSRSMPCGWRSRPKTRRR